MQKKKKKNKKTASTINLRTWYMHRQAIHCIYIPPVLMYIYWISLVEWEWKWEPFQLSFTVRKGSPWSTKYRWNESANQTYSLARKSKLWNNNPKQESKCKLSSYWEEMKNLTSREKILLLLKNLLQPYFCGEAANFSSMPEHLFFWFGKIYQSNTVFFFWSK